MSRSGERIRGMYRAFAEALGPSRWWPGDTPFEVAVGAILTQNTNWKNVERAIANLKQAQAMTERGLRALPSARLEELIRPAGYFRIKTKRLTDFLDFLEEESGLDIEALSRKSLEELRPKLLAVRGIGPETADSILCYALGKQTFVVDAYTMRMFSRHQLIPEQTDYHEVQEIIQSSLPASVQDYNEFHALIVRAAKEWCHKSRPLCAQCPGRSLLPDTDRMAI
ncbi:DNA-3-methyladenine glycosylase III [Humidesulfovibrio mexicanus]|uniref:DNA-3-methyladenine glycosylase III n=1 Tax=Humidesulfovibrio mexicanus TaxID=147047 RepID=A0A239CZ21_9BACT|nr:endonuclease [Humidesulfovibrio mexicanus]SNS25297.1 DNA-3-methyladenine glycosylase III [Humidesulfovibrio mexicanus]